MTNNSAMAFIPVNGLFLCAANFNWIFSLTKVWSFGE